jgi:ubiquinone/menaquinone biosynthesis C-methylase UbiE
MLELARAKLPDVPFDVAPVDDLPVDDASVDLLTCFIALSHVRDLDPVYREFARVLKPGGTLVVSDARAHFTARTSTRAPTSRPTVDGPTSRAGTTRRRRTSAPPSTTASSYAAATRR